MSLIVGISSCIGIDCCFRSSNRLMFRPCCTESSSVARYHPVRGLWKRRPMELQAHVSHSKLATGHLMTWDNGSFAAWLKFSGYFSCFSLSSKSTYGNRRHVNEMCIWYDSMVCSLWRLWTIQIQKRMKKSSMINPWSYYQHFNA